MSAARKLVDKVVIGGTRMTTYCKYTGKHLYPAAISVPSLMLAMPHVDAMEIVEAIEDLARSLRKAAEEAEKETTT